MPATTPELLQAIASLWKIVLPGCILTVIIILRDPIKKALVELTNLKIKRGKTEVSIEKSPAEKPSKAAESVSAEAEQEPEKELPIEGAVAPKEPKEWFREMFNAFRKKGVEDGERAFQKLQESEENAIERIKNETFYHYLKYTTGIDPNALHKLEKLTENEEVRENVLSWIANCYAFAVNYPKAIEAHQRALSEKLRDEDRARHIVQIGGYMSKMDQTVEGLRILGEGLNQVESEDAKATLYEGIANLQKAQGNSLLRAIALQKVLQYKPEDKDTLFQAAYAQSDAELPQLCATNYHTLLKFEADHSWALNNLGVECGKFDMLIKSIRYYKKAVEHDNTLAMSNLAGHYMKQGFKDEAQEILDKAKAMEEPHRNVGESIANLIDRTEYEDKKWDDVIGQGVKQQQFFWCYAEAYFESPGELASFEGQWVSPSGNIFVLEQMGEQMVGKWETESKGEKFGGPICNLAAEITYQQKKPDVVGTGYWGSTRKAFLYLSQDRNTLNIEIVEKDSPISLVLTRKEALVK